MRTNLALLLTLALALAIGCSKNQAGNANSSSGSNPSADNTTANPDNSSASPSSTSAKLSDSGSSCCKKWLRPTRPRLKWASWRNKNAASPKVKDFGQKLVDDHTQNSQQLQQIAQQKGVQLRGPGKAGRAVRQEQIREDEGRAVRQGLHAARKRRSREAAEGTQIAAGPGPGPRREKLYQPDDYRRAATSRRGAGIEGDFDTALWRIIAVLLLKMGPNTGPFSLPSCDSSPSALSLILIQLRFCIFRGAQ